MIQQRKYFFLSLFVTVSVILLLTVHYFFFLKEHQNAPAGLRSPEEYNAYLAKHHHFDSVILGSSMSMCFRCSEFDKICNGFSYKLTVPGCEVPVWVDMAKYICRHQKIHAVLADLHLELLLLPETHRSYIEDYYSDKDFLSVLKAASSLKTIRERRIFYWDKFRKKYKEETFSRDDLHDWSKEYPCGKIFYAKQICRHSYRPDPKRKLSYVRQNLKPLADFIRQNPQIRFYLYLPPYSVLAHDTEGQYVYARREVMDILLPFPNVELYDFQSAEFVTDFDNYKDLTHFSKEISSWILRKIRKKKYLVTPGNRKDFEQKYAEKILTFDREKAIAELKEYYRAHAQK